MHEASAQRIKDKAIGYRMHEASGDSAQARKGFQSVARDGEAQWQRLARPTLAQAQEFLDIQIARRGTIQLTKALRHRGADVALDDHIGARADSG